MKHRNFDFMVLVRSLWVILVAGFVPIGNFTVRAAPQVPQDTPTPVVTEKPNEWTLGSGLLYWAERCAGGEFRGPGYLRRKPANGGTTITLSTVGNDACYTFLTMAADAEGLYYYSADGGGIYHRPVGDPYDPATLVLTTDQAPVGGSNLVLAGDYIYWITYDWTTSEGSLLRVMRDGTGLATVAESLNNPEDLLVVGTTVYWLDDDGLWSTSVSCASLPCAKSRLVSTRGDHLLYRATFAASSVYWVADEDTIEGIPQRIRRYTCPLIGDCTTTTLYNAPSTAWQLGQLGTDGTHLFWPQYYYTISEGYVEGGLKRMPIGGGTADDIATNMPHIMQTLFTDSQYVYFAETATTTSGGIYRLPFDATVIERDLAADELEVTQGIQNLAHDVPLVAHKPTYVRAYGREDSGPAAMGVEAYLYGTRGGSPLPASPLHPINGSLALATGGSYDRANVDDGWLFQLPYSWTDAGTVTLRLVVDPRDLYNDPQRADNEMNATFTFIRKAHVCTVFVPVRTHASRYDRPSENPNFGAMIDVANRLWPVHDIWTYRQSEDIAELQVCWKWGFIPYPCFGPYELPDDTWKVLTSLNVRDFFSDDPDECDHANARTHYAGMVHPSTNTGSVLGAAYLDDNVFWVKFAPHAPTSSSAPAWPDAGATIAHEMGHNLNRRHVDCGNPDNVDTGYPYPTDQIANVGPANHYGFDVRTLTVIAPDAARDIMSYCRPYWTSDYTWKALLNRISSGRMSSGRMSTAPTRVTLAEADNAVFVSGAITPSLNTGGLNYAWVYPTARLSAGILQKWQTLADSAVSGRAPTVDYYVRLLDNQDTVLADHPVSLTQPIDDLAANPVSFFAATFPAPSGTVARIELRANGTLLAHRDPYTHSPTVTIVQPAGGETFDEQMQLVWQASDPDADDTLLHTIQYSPDNGQTWFALLNDFPGPQNAETVTVSLAHLGIPGSAANEGFIRVAASDGYHTGLATSAPFTVSPRDPEPYIVSPLDGEPWPAGQAVSLRGDANDAEDGGLSGDALTWAVDGQTHGTGQEWLVTGLAPGDHAVTLTARDTDAQEGTAQATFTILPLGVPQGGAPTLDGFCDDTMYGNGISIQLAPHTDGDQATVHVLRSQDYLWLCFHSMALGSGDARAGVRIDADYSQDAQAQSDDYVFLVGEDGSFSTYAGDGAGGFTDPGPGGLRAQVSANASAWSAELRIAADTIGGWDQVIGMALGHYDVDAQDDDYTWPYEATRNAPSTWAATALGSLPQIDVLDPVSTTAGLAGFTLEVTGANFVDGTTVYWDGTTLPTAFIDSGHLTASIAASTIATAGTVDITARNPSPDALNSNPVSFVVHNPVPSISSLQPETVQAGGAALTLTVQGANFVAGATVLWNGAVCATDYVNATQVTAQVTAAHIAEARSVGITVRNPAPDSHVSNVAWLTVQAQAGPTIFLPLILRD